MNCAACGHPNPERAKFCLDCGRPFALRCASCGVELPPAAKFCLECGAPTGAPAAKPAPTPSGATGDARKVVTIVFGDLVGSTALHERLDAESVRAFMEGYYAAMRGAVEAHGGRVTQLMGDGVKAVFGAPRVSEDDALRAVRAAVAMQEAFRALADARRGRVGKTGLRVAVNTGEVVANDATEIIGDPVNVAARLQEQGKDGDVVIGGSTQRIVAALVTLERLGSFALKGRAEPVEAYRVVSLEPPEAAKTAPFVGRTEELARLEAVYATAVEKPAAGLAVLVGSPGLGKSRLVDEFARRHAEAATVIRAHCDAAGGATFAPLAQALRAPLGIEAGSSGEMLRAAVSSALPDDADRARIAGGIAALLAGSPGSPEETFYVVRRLLAALARERPVVLVVDDLHWGEPLLLDLVEHLIQWGSGAPLFVLIGARPELRELRSSLVTPGGFVTDVVTLTGLDAAAAMRLAASVVGAADLPAAIAGKVLATSEGNPLFVAELVRMLVQEGALTREGERWIVGAKLASLEMPPTIHALLAARIERLRPEERTVLERAAVVGRHFSRRAVAALLPREAGDLDARLEALRRSELIERDTGWLLGDPVLRFHHVLIRDAAYRRLLKGTRAELHAQLADWIEAQAGDAPEHDETIGWHLEQAHQLLTELGPLDEAGEQLGARAARRLAAAGRRALERDDLPVAANLLGRALARLDADDPARAALALDGCEALLSAGDVGSAAGAIDELGRLAAGDERLAAWHACFAGQLTVLTAPRELGATAEAIAAAAQGLTALGDAAGEAKAHFVHALALSRLGAVGACEAALDRALAAARRAGDRRRANTVLAIAPLAALWGPSPVTRASGRCLDVVRVLRITQGAPAVEAVALSCQGVLEALRGRTEAARRMIASARKMVEELGITQRLLEADVSAGLVALLEGDAAAAERTLRSAYEGLRELGLGIDAARAAALLARALLAAGRAPEAEALSRESEALAGDDLKAAIAWRGVRAEALARRGEHAAAVALASQAVELAAATDALLDHADARLALAAALRAAGRSHEADAEERRARELWQAKGATLLAERARNDGVRRPSASAPVLAAQPPPRRRVRPNAVTENAARLDAAISARDTDALPALITDDLVVVDHTTGAEFGREGALASWRALIGAHEPISWHDPLATLGDSLGLFRMRASASGIRSRHWDVGAYEKDEFHLVEVDAKGQRRTRGELWATGHLPDAIARLYERYAELQPEGSERERAARAAVSFGTPLQAGGEPELMAQVLAPHFESVDHRPLRTWSVRGSAAFLAHVRALRDVATDLAMSVDEVLALTPNALLLRRLHSGTDRASGGRYERAFLVLFVTDADGRLARAEWFDPESEPEALALFDALAVPAAAVRPGSRRVPSNAAARSVERLEAAFAARDAAAWAAEFDEPLTVIAHPTGASYGREGHLRSLLRLAQSRDPVLHFEPLATLGGNLVLARRHVAASGATSARYEVGAYEREEFVLSEVGANGRTMSIELFPLDRLGDAVARLYARHAELLPEGPERTRAAGAARSIVGMYTGLVDRARLANPFAPDVECVDHRVAGFGTLHGDRAVLEAVGAFLDLVEAASWRIDDVLALTERDFLLRSTNRGTERAGGGAFLREILSVVVLGADGRIVRWEIFEANAEAAALARFDALAEVPTRPGTPRRVRPNAATALGPRFGAAFASGDLDGFAALLAPSLEYVDHPVGASYGRDGAMAGIRAQLRAREPRYQQEQLVTLGDRLLLGRRTISADATVSTRFDVGSSENVTLVLQETDGAGATLQRIEVFATDRIGDAVVRLYERYAALQPEGLLRSRAEAIARAVAVVAPGGFDRERYAEVFRPDVEIVDHKLLGLGAGVGRELLFRSMEAWRGIADHVVSRPQDVLALAPDALLLGWRASGVGSESGGAFELAFLRLFVFDAEGRVARYELFEAEHEAEALARFEALAAPPAPPRRRVRPNAATASVERFTASLGARDREAIAEFFDASLRVVHHPSGASYGKREMLATWRSAMRAERLEFRYEALASLGGSLALGRQVTAVEGLVEPNLREFGPTEVAELSVIETGSEGCWLHIELFAPDRLGDALVCLYERYAAALADGPERMRAAGVARSIAALDGPVDLDRLQAVLAPASRTVDHRVFGTWSARDAHEQLRHWRAQLDLAPDFTARFEEVRACDPDGLVIRVTAFGTARDGGGAFENHLCIHFAFGDDGRVKEIDISEAEQEADALARFDALAGGDAVELAADPFENAASRADRALFDCFNTRDWPGVEALAAPGLVFDERRRLMHNTCGREVWLEQFRVLFDVPASRFETRLLATRGERLALNFHRFTGEVAGGGGPLAMEDQLALHEVDGEGRILAIVLFDLDSEAAAHAELDARFAAGEAARLPILHAAQRRSRLLADRDLPGFAAMHAPSFVYRDHRRLGWGSAAHDFETLLRVIQSAFDLSPDARYRKDHVRLGARGVWEHTTLLGTRDGGAFENPMHLVLAVDEHGRIASGDTYDIEDLERARARFAELSAPARTREPFANAASRTNEALVAAFNARDRARIEARVAEAIVFDDRRRGVRLATGREETLASFRFFLDVPGIHVSTRLVATRGERLALHVTNVEGGVAGGGGAFELGAHLDVVEVDAEGRIIWNLLFDPEDEEAARAELDARFEGGRAGEPGAGWRALRAVHDPVASRSWGDVLGALAPGWSADDHRTLGWGTTLDRPEMFVRSQQSLAELSPDFRYRFDHVRSTSRAYVVQLAQVGTREGGAFESPFVYVATLDASARPERFELFDVAEADRALARFAELAAPARARAPFVNTATRTVERATAAQGARDWEAFGALFAPGFRQIDRRAYAQLEADREGFLRSHREIIEMTSTQPRPEFLATRGERLALVRILWEGAEGDVGPSEIEWLLLVEVDERGNHTLVIAFDPHDLDAAYDELDARWAAGEASVHPAASTWVAEFRRAFASRDWEAIAALHASDQVAQNHRLVGWGTLRGPGAWVPTLQELVELAPDVQQRVHHLRTCERGLLWHHAWRGTRDGGPFESPMLVLVELDEHGRERRIDVWEPEQLGEALARFEALRAPAARDPLPTLAKPTAASVALDRWWAALDVGAATDDWQPLRAVCEPVVAFADRTRFSQISGDLALAIESIRARAASGLAIQGSLVEPVGERVAIARAFWSGGAADSRVEVEYFAVAAVAESGRICAITLFDDLHAARREAWARHAEIGLSAQREPRAALAPSNLATVTMESAWAAFDAFDPGAGEASLAAARVHFAPDFVWEDRRPLLGLSGGVDLMLASARERLASGARHERRSVVATAGERVAIANVLWAGGPPDGRFEVEFLALHEVDEAGLCTALLFFEPSEGRAAQREAWARWRAHDPRAAVTAPFGEILDAFDAQDRERMRAQLADDLVVEDHRRTGVGRIEGADAQVASLAALWDLAPETKMDGGWHWLACDRHGGLTVVRRVGTVPGGGPFESEFLWLSIVVGGRLTRLELFEPDAVDEALARFEALRPDPLAIPPNAAVRALAQAAGDPAALRALAADDFMFDDRTRRSLLRGGVEEWLRSVTYLRGEIRGRPDFRLLATAGDRRALLHAAWQETLGDAPFAIDIYSVVDADAAGRLRAIVLFGTEDRAAAHAELFERWAASDADGPPAASVAFLRAVNAHDLVAVRAALCDDFVYDDRRLVGLGRLAGADAYLPSLSAFFGLSADARIDMLYEVARAPHGHVTVCRTWGTNAEGGDFETPFVMLLHFRGGLVAGLERFELEELGAALARLDALRPDPLRIPDNAATRAGMEFARAAYARDWEAVRDLCAPDFVFEDRGKRALVTGGVEAWIASVEYTTTLPGVRIETPRVTALGERICVQAIRWGSTEGAFEFGRLRLLEVDSEGRVRATLFFDPEDRFAASNEALARFAAGEAAGARGVEAFAAWRLASASRDVEGVERLLAPAFEYVDHRRLGLGTLSAAEWVASCRVVAELSPDAGIETLRILAWNAHGVLLATRSFGSVPNGGGPFENLMLVACVAGPAGIEHFELFEIDDVERARARFEALAAGGAG